MKDDRATLEARTAVPASPHYQRLADEINAVLALPLPVAPQRRVSLSDLLRSRA